MIRRRKCAAVLLLCCLCLAAAACGENSGGTYYPDSAEMEKNLQNAGYVVDVTEELGEDWPGTRLTAAKGSDFIKFYWLDDGGVVEDVTNALENEQDGYDKIVSIQEDAQFGSLVCCGTAAAMDDAGICIVHVKTDVKVDV